MFMFSPTYLSMPFNVFSIVAFNIILMSIYFQYSKYDVHMKDETGKKSSLGGNI